MFFKKYLFFSFRFSHKFRLDGMFIRIGFYFTVPEAMASPSQLYTTNYARLRDQFWFPSRTNSVQFLGRSSIKVSNHVKDITVMASAFYGAKIQIPILLPNTRVPVKIITSSSVNPNIWLSVVEVENSVCGWKRNFLKEFPIPFQLSIMHNFLTIKNSIVLP